MAAVTRRQYKGAAASTTITATLTSVATTTTLTATTGWPSTASVPFYVVIDPGNSSEEKCSATISGSTLTLTRGADNTTAVAHSSGATIYPVFSAVEADEANNMAATMTTKGDLLVTTGSAFNRLPVGTNGFGLIADSASTNGVKWGTPYNQTVSTKTASYTLVAADAGTRIVMNAGATDTTITVNTSLFAAGDTLFIHNIGAGTCTVTAGTATVGSSGSLVVPTNGGGTLYFTSASSAIFFNTANIDQTKFANANAFINGAFDINQRAFTSQTTDGGYGFDRWRMYASAGGTYSAQTFTAGAAPVAGYEATNFARIVTTGQTGAGIYTSLDQPVEDVRTFAGQTVTVSFWAKAASGTPKVSLEIVHNYGSGGSGAVFTNGGTATISTSWARYSLTVSVPSVSGKTIGAGSYMDPGLWVSAGTTFSARTNAIGIQSNTFDFWGIKLEAGSVATEFGFENIGITLAKCQRYYIRQGGDTAFQTLGAGIGFSGTVAIVTTVLPTKMRVTPTSIEFSLLRITDSSSIGVAITALALDINANCSFQPTMDATVASGLTATKFYFITANNSTSGFLAFSAEL